MRSIALVPALFACSSPVVPRPPPAAVPTVAASQPVSPGARISQPREEPPCPAIDYAGLEPDKPVPDTRLIALTEVFPADERRLAGATAPTFDLGLLRFERRAAGPWMGKMHGMGWEGLEAEWVESGLSAPVRAPFKAWLEARKALGEHQRAGYLLGTGGERAPRRARRGWRRRGWRPQAPLHAGSEGERR